MYPPQPGAPGPYGAPPQQGYPQPQQPQPVNRELQGQLVNVEQRQGGWHRFHIAEPGKQYATKVDTKKPEMVQQALSLMGQMVAAQITEQPSPKINPHNNQPYMNRYLNGIAPAGFAPGVMPNPGAPNAQGQTYQSPAQQQYPTPTHSEPVQQFTPGLSGMEKEVSIVRQTAAKVVAMQISAIPPDQRDARGLVEAAEVWVAYFLQGPLRFGVTPFNQPRQPQPGPQPQPIQPQPAPQYGGQQPPEYAPKGAQTDIFGAPYDGDPGPQQGQYESLAQ